MASLCNPTAAHGLPMAGPWALSAQRPDSPAGSSLNLVARPHSSDPAQQVPALDPAPAG